MATRAWSIASLTRAVWVWFFHHWRVVAEDGVLEARADPSISATGTNWVSKPDVSPTTRGTRRSASRRVRSCRPVSPSAVASTTQTVSLPGGSPIADRLGREGQVGLATPLGRAGSERQRQPPTLTCQQSGGIAAVVPESHPN